MNALWALLARATSGHPGYDRGIRDHASDARFAHSKGDSYGMAYWGARAITLSLMADRGHRHDANAGQRYAAMRDAAEFMGDERVIRDTGFEISKSIHGERLYREAQANKR